MVTGGKNVGRVGVITHHERHHGGFDIVHVKDVLGHDFATRMQNVMVIGQGNKPLISLPRGKGVKLSIAEERDRRMFVYFTFLFLVSPRLVSELCVSSSFALHVSCQIFSFPCTRLLWWPMERQHARAHSGLKQSQRSSLIRKTIALTPSRYLPTHPHSAQKSMA